MTAQIPEPLADLLGATTALIEIARVANRNHKSLRGHGHYGAKFHDAVIALSRSERESASLFAALEEPTQERIRSALAALRNPEIVLRAREDAGRTLKTLVELEVVPVAERIGRPTIPKSEPVLPVAVLRNAPKYLHEILLQANGCYLEGWYDASAVMIRRLIESLIIELYERSNKAEEIRKDGEYLMFSGLVSKLLGQSHWHLGREVRRGLPGIKLLGDRSAHSRHYLATRHDIDSAKGALRVTTDFLVHQGGLA